MTVQLSYDNAPGKAVEGMLADGGPNSIVSARATSRKLMSVAVTASNSKIYTITLNGTSFVYTADSSATTAEIVLGLKALINAGDEPVLASGTDTPLLIESTIDGPAGDFTYADSVDSVGTLVETLLVAQGQEIPFGKFVCMDERSSLDDAVRLPRQSTDVTGGRARGVCLEDKAREANVDGAVFRANTMVPVVEMGRIYVKVEQDVVKGDAAYVRYVAGGNGLGSFGNSAGSSERAALAHASYDSTTASGGLAVLKVNI